MANALLITDQPLDLSSYGIECVEWSHHQKALEQKQPTALLLHTSPSQLEQVKSLLIQNYEQTLRSSIAILHEDWDSTQALEILKYGRPVAITTLRADLPWSDLLSRCFDSYYQKEQEQQLVQLISEKNSELKILTLSLEEKVRDRQSQLESSRQRSVSTQKQMESIRNALLHIHQSNGPREMEHGLTHALKNEFAVAHVRIRAEGQSSLPLEEKTKAYKTELKSGPESFGYLLFYPHEGQKFEARDKKFFTQVGDATALALQRKYQYDKSQELRLQWEATFDAISDPICLTDFQYNILRVNQSFLKKTGLNAHKDTLNRKCYEVLFNKPKPCQGCQRGELFQIQSTGQGSRGEVFEVTSHQLGEDSYFQMYRDITQDLNLQRQVIESAKMAELGTISSSIAHELNNPIGGMLNFVQLMKMDLNGDEEFYPDLIEIEKGIQKCKEIVKNLLGFSRQSVDTEVQVVDLVEVISQAIKITELKTRSIGIAIDFEQPAYPITIPGRFNLLTHAIRNLLQNSQESLFEERRNNKTFKGQIKLSIQETPTAIEINISDNGKGIDPVHRSKIFDPLYTTKDPNTNSGLGLTLALQIMREHQGEIHITTDKDKNLCFQLVFNKPQVQSGSK